MSRSTDRAAQALANAKLRMSRSRIVQLVSSGLSTNSSISAMVPPGTLSLLVTRADSTFLPEVRQALDGRRDAREVGRRLLAEMAKPGRIAGDRFAQALRDADVVGEFRYGGRTLAEGIFVPRGNEAALYIFPYIGARVSPDAFSFVEYVAPGSKASLDALVLAHTPPLTEAEAEALRKLPADHEYAVGSPGALVGNVCWAWCAIIIAVAAYAVHYTVNAEHGIDNIPPDKPKGGGVGHANDFGPGQDYVGIDIGPGEHQDDGPGPSWAADADDAGDPTEGEATDVDDATDVDTGDDADQAADESGQDDNVDGDKTFGFDPGDAFVGWSKTQASTNTPEQMFKAMLATSGIPEEEIGLASPTATARELLRIRAAILRNAK